MVDGGGGDDAMTTNDLRGGRLMPDLTLDGLRARAMDILWRHCQDEDQRSGDVFWTDARREEYFQFSDAQRFTERLTAAFTALVAEARRAQREADIRAVCLSCEWGWLLCENEPTMHVIPLEHRDDPSVYYEACRAAEIRAQEEKTP